MKDQRALWDDSHTKRQLHKHSLVQTAFAEEINEFISDGSSILELGCGEGNDSIYFAQQGHAVTATDFSQVIVDRNSRNLPHPHLKFQVQDISTTLNFSDDCFDIIYARLSLHYFTDSDTQRIFTELRRVLKPGGYLCFMCKSVDDSLYGQGDKIEQDMFELEGHVRHFFSEAYTRQLLTEHGFNIHSIEQGQDKLYERLSAFIKAMAQKETVP